MITGYYDQAPLDEYGLLRQPKWGHLKELHAAVKLCLEAILSAFPTMHSLGPLQEVIHYTSLMFSRIYRAIVLSFNGETFRLIYSVEIQELSAQDSWKCDQSDSWEQESEEQAKLSVQSLGHVLHAFVNGNLVGYGHGQFRNTTFTVESKVALNKGTNQISLLSATVGLPNSGAFLERRSLGVRSVMIQDSQGLKNFTDISWGYQVGLLGEKLQIYTWEGAKCGDWSRLSSSTQQFTWYKSIFDAPNGDDLIALNMGSMGKGEAWVNGQSIGRYWVSFHTPEGVPSQTWYNVPRSFLKPEDNVLVLFEEEIGNPLNITIDTISITQVCAHVTDSNPPPVISWRKYETSKDHKPSKRKKHGSRPKVYLNCPPRSNNSKILFASFGNPSGNCDDCATGLCHSSNSKAIVEKACLGKKKCTIAHSHKKFGRDPCPGLHKSLLVDVLCG
ncbi:putative beta-galactosidase 16-like [Capsicum annuum]|nr:putative beta-galactosidase 16-like [Capsicum annuum]KAF3673336.1 putative beta-galactosidase 16-like [Capsicum annuum]